MSLGEASHRVDDLDVRCEFGQQFGRREPVGHHHVGVRQHPATAHGDELGIPRAPADERHSEVPGVGCSGGDDALLQDALGAVMTRIDEQALAIELFDQAIALRPDLASLYYNRAVAQRAFGLLAGAERDLEECLELNPAHPLVTGLNQAHTERGADTALEETAELLHDMALLAEGGEVADPARFVKLVADRLERTL